MNPDAVRIAIQEAWVAHLRADRPSNNTPMDDQYEAFVHGWTSAVAFLAETLKGQV